MIYQFCQNNGCHGLISNLRILKPSPTNVYFSNLKIKCFPSIWKQQFIHFCHGNWSCCGCGWKTHWVIPKVCANSWILSSIFCRCCVKEIPNLTQLEAIHNSFARIFLEDGGTRSGFALKFIKLIAAHCSYGSNINSIQPKKWYVGGGGEKFQPSLQPTLNGTSGR